MLKKLFEKKTEYVKIYNNEFLGNFKVLKKTKNRWKVLRMSDNGSETNDILNINPNLLTIKKLDFTTSCGILFVYDNKFLIVKQLGDNYSYPKGKIETGETLQETAVREVEEEIGIKFPKELLPKKHHTISWFMERKFKIYHYFIYNLNKEEFNKYFNGEYTIPTKNLQEEEILWGGFVSYNDLQKKLSRRFFSILKHF